MNERRVTMSDIAEKADVHVTTVSLALRNHPRLPEATRRRIQALAAKMGYAPDPFLRALVSYRGKVRPHRNPAVLAYITNWPTRWGWKKVTAHPEFFEGAKTKADELGFNLEHFWLGEPGLTHSRLSDILRSRGINGVIIASHVRDLDEELQFDWEHLSGVKIDYFPHQPELHNVTNNQSSIVRLAVRKILQAGYRKIGFVMHRGWDHAVDHLWTGGFLCEQQYVPSHERIPAHIFPGPVPIERWFNESKADVAPEPEAFDAWFYRYKPDVIVSKSAFVLPHLQRLGLRIPEDIAFVDTFLEDFSGEIAGVRQNHHAVGELAVEILAGQLQHNKFGVPKIPTTTYVEGTWFDGASCPKRSAVRVELAVQE